MRRLVANDVQELLDSELQCEACGLNLLGASRSLRAKLAGYNGRQLGHGLDTPAGSGGCARWACLSASRAWQAAAIAIV